jgi:hypothetical protein
MNTLNISMGNDVRNVVGGVVIKTVKLGLLM